MNTHTVREHVALTPEQRMAVALWTVSRSRQGLPCSARCAGVGKTTLVILIECVVANPDRSDNTTAAVIYHSLARGVSTLLVDEGDNLGLFSNAVLRAIFNAGHRRGSVISRFIGGWPRRYSVFAPLATASIGALPLPLMARSVIISMHRLAPDQEPLFKKLDEFDQAFPVARAEIQKWAATCSLTREPEMPPELHNRAADNWRVLLAIADDLGHGEKARAAAIALSAGRLDEDPGIVLLTDIRKVFDGSGVDRISSSALITALLELEDSLWHDWRGPKDDRAPRKINPSELARLLRSFGIIPRTVWPMPRRPSSKSRRGYSRSQFEAVWSAYCPGDTPTQRKKNIKLIQT